MKDCRNIEFKAGLQEVKGQLGMVDRDINRLKVGSQEVKFNLGLVRAIYQLLKGVKIV